MKTDNDFFTEQFDSESMANIAGLLGYMAGMVAAQGKDPDSGNATDLEMSLQSASIKLSRLADRLSAMESLAPAQPC